MAWGGDIWVIVFIAASSFLSLPGGLTDKEKYAARGSKSYSPGVRYPCRAPIGTPSRCVALCCRQSSRQQPCAARHPAMRPETSNPFDRSLKVLIRRALPTLLRLAGMEIDPALIRPDDTAINLPEHNADHLFHIGAADDPARWALHLEYQLQPDSRVLPDWFYKNAALNKLLEIPV